MCEISVRLKVVTPILGGGPKLRDVDRVDIIRVPTVRGHLRFWWRALYGHQYTTSQELYAAESALWGRPADNTGSGGRSGVVEVDKEGARSSVDVRIDVDRSGLPKPDETPVEIGSVKGYALWPAREPHADRRPPGTDFQLTIIGPAAQEVALKNVVRAWILFGGYGSRTRRGLGSLTVAGDNASWLPPATTKDASGFRTVLTELFSTDVFSGQPACPTVETPILARASLFMGDAVRATTDNPDAGTWAIALGWLRDFRQGMNTGARRRPAKGDPEPRRPSISHWPEADVWRSIEGGTYSHSSRYAGQRAYPRAGFGLPIQTRFQSKRRGGGVLQEPDNFTLYWHDGANVHDRFGSALIVKALPLRGNMFAPCALWLTRAYPAKANVVVRETTVAQTGASFDANYIAHPDAPEFVKSAGVDGLREAFTNWLYYDAPAQLQQTIRAISA